MAKRSVVAVDFAAAVLGVPSVMLTDAIAAGLVKGVSVEGVAAIDLDDLTELRSKGLPTAEAGARRLEPQPLLLAGVDADLEMPDALLAQLSSQQLLAEAIRLLTWLRAVGPVVDEGGRCTACERFGGHQPGCPSARLNTEIEAVTRAARAHIRPRP